MKTIYFPFLIFVLCFLLTACNLLHRPEKYEFSETPVECVITTVRFECDTSIFLASANKEVKISVILNQEAAEDRRQVLFSSTSGTFKDGMEGSEDEVLVVANRNLNSENDSLMALAYLTVTKPDSVVVTVEVLNYQVKDTLIFDRLWPSSIKTDPGTFAMEGSFDSTYTLLATVNSEEGIPSRGAKVDFSVELPNGTPFGWYRNKNLKSNDEGKVSATFSPGNITYSGDIYFIAKTIDIEGDTISHSSIFRLN